MMKQKSSLIVVALKANKCDFGIIVSVFSPVNHTGLYQG